MSGRVRALLLQWFARVVSVPHREDLRMKTKSLVRLAPFAPIALFALVGCNQQLIPNTDIEDTQMNRSIVDFCEKYRHAVEHRNVSELLTLAHPDYYEDGGNADATDDLDYAGLKSYLEKKFVNARAIRYEIRYRDVQTNERKGYNITYTYSATYQLPDGPQLVWHREVADNQLQLVPEGDTYKIVSGM
jgi:hypothetical protein